MIFLVASRDEGMICEVKKERGYLSSSEIRFFNKSVFVVSGGTFPVVDFESLNPVKWSSNFVNHFSVASK